MKKFLVLVLVTVIAYQLPAQPQGSFYKDAVHSNKGVVSCFSNYAAKVGIDVLERGGNAADAAIAMTFAIGVTRPDANGIGGGGFLLYRSNTGEVKALDFRESAPKAVKPETFKGTGMHKDDLNILGGGSGHMVVGVPGTVRGLAEALDKLGSGKFTLCQLISSGIQPDNPSRNLPIDPTDPTALPPDYKVVDYSCPRDPLLQPAEVPYAYELAKYGIEVSEVLKLLAFFNRPRNKYYEEFDRIYGRLDEIGEEQEEFRRAGQPVPKELLFKQKDYARSLALIMEFGPDVFYKKAEHIPGFIEKTSQKTIADMIVYDMDEKNIDKKRAFHPNSTTDIGLMTAEDLADYKAIWRRPLSINYHDYQVYGMPPPTSGGITALQTLNLLEHFPLNPNDANWKQSSANHFHVLAEAQKIAWADRNAYIGDPDFVTVPTQALISKGYAQKRYSDIDITGEKNTAKPMNAKGGVGQADRHGTMHLSVIDQDGNAVSITNTINGPFGSVVVAPGTGFVLNEHLTDFNMDAPGTANEPNGGKRPRSSASPTIVVKEGKPVMVTGGAGGSSIIMGVVQAIVNVVNFGRTIAHAVDDVRIEAVSNVNWCNCEERDIYAGGSHANYLGIESRRVGDAVIDELKWRGHRGRDKDIPSNGKSNDESDDIDRKETVGGETVIEKVAGINGDYSNLPILYTVGYNFKEKRNEAVSDPRSEDGSATQPEKKDDLAPLTLRVMQQMAGKAEVKDPNSLSLSITVTPNPSAQYFTLQVKSKESKVPITLRVTDMIGKVVEQKAGLVAGQTLQIGHTYPSGIYQVEVIQGRERTVRKIIKQTK